MTECTKCGERKITARGLCRKCYDAKYRAEHSEKMRACSERNNRLRGHKPMSENRDCALFLGVHVAERVLSKIFKDVQKMPMNHSGYDFICNRGKRIDVKSSTIHTVAKQSDCWIFRIERNRIADYFLLIAFDNRDDLTPQHIWLMPGNAVNDRIAIGVSVTTIDKWDEYRIPIDKTIACCDKLKHGGWKQDD